MVRHRRGRIGVRHRHGTECGPAVLDVLADMNQPGIVLEPHMELHEQGFTGGHGVLSFHIYASQAGASSAKSAKDSDMRRRASRRPALPTVCVGWGARRSLDVARYTRPAARLRP